MMWIQTYTGKKFYPIDPVPQDICLEDIAHALALTCRYNGHCRTFYSVAEHSVRVSWAARDSIWGLFHDAAEAYISDVTSPVKAQLPGFQTIEFNLQKAICRKFNISQAPYFSDVVFVDQQLAATEKRDLLLHNIDWGVEMPEPLAEVIVPWRWEVAESKFLQRAKELLNL